MPDRGLLCRVKKASTPFTTLPRLYPWWHLSAVCMRVCGHAPALLLFTTTPLLPPFYHHRLHARLCMPGARITASFSSRSFLPHVLFSFLTCPASSAGWMGMALCLPSSARPFLHSAHIYIFKWPSVCVCSFSLPLPLSLCLCAFR